MILGVVFLLIITPIGKSALHLKTKSNVESYWINRTPPGPKTGSMTRQY
jgi:hypothetical protein